MKLCFVGASERCSLNCEHCYLGERENPSDLSLALASNFFEQVKNLEPKAIAIEGDHPQLEKLVGEATKTGLNITISTSYNYLGDDNTKKLTTKIKSFVISLDGYNAKTHDKVRGTPGSFEKTIETIRFIQSEGGHVSVLSSLSNRNISELGEMTKFLLSLNVNVISFLYTSSFGKAKDKNLSIPPDKWKETCEELEGLRKTSASNIFYEPVFCNNNFQDKNPCSLYTRDYMALDSLGNIYFCPLFINKEDGRYALGNIARDELGDIWFNSPDWEKFKEMKNDLDDCHGCFDYDLCGGECFADLVLNKTEDRPKALCYLHWSGL